MQEYEFRKNRWTALQQAGGPLGVTPGLLRELGIYGGMQGVWVDKARTGKLAPGGTGITVGVLHTGSSYADDLSSDGVLYHYPKTGRPPRRDVAEVAATKAAGEHKLPIFVITYPARKSKVRDVHLGWIEGWDDKTGIFLISFDTNVQPPLIVAPVEQENFSLTSPASGVTRPAPARPGQARFSFKVFKRYGPTCAVCTIAIKEVLEAAHIRGKQYRGSDDARNGLVLCATHHRAYDAGLFAIDPSTLALHARPIGPTLSALQITQTSITHLINLPHPEALTWAWRKWQGVDEQPSP